ncbi:hypothetical protein [Cytobacillus purgationiresistens]|uniref:Uncharacterized protein n=1 Tax=Cytobacillus purgationiresistens TaxID=863449 RepID=A0ABU0AHN8_9BACI|nr:hypothetical protein [Cytobacillus purgationiresistens]MDQ0270773.1 hypothetical protein [Cytobacillus purgationiresistens]
MVAVLKRSYDPPSAGTVSVTIRYLTAGVGGRSHRRRKYRHLCRQGTAFGTVMARLAGSTGDRLSLAVRRATFVGYSIESLSNYGSSRQAGCCSGRGNQSGVRKYLRKQGGK